MLKLSDMTRDNKGITVLPATLSRTIPAFTPHSSAAEHHYPWVATHCTYPQRDGQAELTWVAGYILRYIFPHQELNSRHGHSSSTNGARRMESNNFVDQDQRAISMAVKIN